MVFSETDKMLSLIHCASYKVFQGTGGLRGFQMINAIKRQQLWTWPAIVANAEIITERNVLLWAFWGIIWVIQVFLKMDDCSSLFNLTVLVNAVLVICISLSPSNYF